MKDTEIVKKEEKPGTKEVPVVKFEAKPKTVVVEDNQKEEMKKLLIFFRDNVLHGNASHVQRINTVIN